MRNDDTERNKNMLPLRAVCQVLCKITGACPSYLSCAAGMVSRWNFTPLMTA